MRSCQPCSSASRRGTCLKRLPSCAPRQLPCVRRYLPLSLHMSPQVTLPSTNLTRSYHASLRVMCISNVVATLDPHLHGREEAEADFPCYQEVTLTALCVLRKACHTGHGEAAPAGGGGGADTDAHRAADVVAGSARRGNLHHPRPVRAGRRPHCGACRVSRGVHARHLPHTGPVARPIRRGNPVCCSMLCRRRCQSSDCNAPSSCRCR